MSSARTDAAATDATVILAGHRPGEARASGQRAPLLRHAAPVAVMSSAFAVLAFITYSPGAEALITAFMAAVLVVLAATDIERRIIPNRIVLPATAIALVAHLAVTPGRSSDFILAAIGGGVAFFIPNMINRSLMGMGDVKLVVLLGAGLGWGVVGAVTVAFLSVFPVAVVTLIRGGAAARKATLPFGPFLALGGLCVLIAPHLAGLG
jgi:leader peptidase (prepilin peptidase)/N-methyltransferase